MTSWYSCPGSARSPTPQRFSAATWPRAARGATEVLPLYGRLSVADQHRVFSPHTGRRIVLATNVAETSLTVPGIHYVIDPGTARISRYSSRTKVQRLPIERISQASAGQRAGRCGRVADGVCIRLYSAKDFADRPEFTDPEIARTSLASVILQMASLDLGDIATFPFLDPPDQRRSPTALTVLGELGAIDPTSAPGTHRADRGRPRDREASGRPASGQDADRGRPAGLPRRDSRDCRRPGDPGRQGVPVGRPGPRGRRPLPVLRPVVGLPDHAQPLGIPGPTGEGVVRQRVSSDVPGRVPALPAHQGVAGPARPAVRDRRGPRDGRACPRQPCPIDRPRPASRAGAGTSGRRRGRSDATPEPGGAGHPAGPRLGDGRGGRLRWCTPHCCRACCRTSERG